MQDCIRSETPWARRLRLGVQRQCWALGGGCQGECEGGQTALSDDGRAFWPDGRLLVTHTLVKSPPCPARQPQACHVQLLGCSSWFCLSPLGPRSWGCLRFPACDPHGLFSCM